MLTLKHKPYLDLSSLIEELTPGRQVAFVPVTDDDDELTQAIANDDAEKDNLWELSERPDPDELNSFWTKVSEEARQDPDWVFDED